MTGAVDVYAIDGPLEGQVLTVPAASSAYVAVVPREPELLRHWGGDLNRVIESDTVVYTFRDAALPSDTGPLCYWCHAPLETPGPSWLRIHRIASVAFHADASLEAHADAISAAPTTVRETRRALCTACTSLDGMLANRAAGQART